MNVRVAAAVLTGAALVLPGCLVNSHSRTEYTGRYIGPETFGQIEAGKSSRQFVLATLGEPTAKTPMDDGTELWKWEHRRTQSSNGTVFLLFSGSGSTQRDGAAYVMFQDGVVCKKWRD